MEFLNKPHWFIRYNWHRSYTTLRELIKILRDLTWYKSPKAKCSLRSGNYKHAISHCEISNQINFPQLGDNFQRLFREFSFSGRLFLSIMIIMIITIISQPLSNGKSQVRTTRVQTTDWLIDRVDYCNAVFYNISRSINCNVFRSDIVDFHSLATLRVRWVHPSNDERLHAKGGHLVLHYVVINAIKRSTSRSINCNVFRTPTTCVWLHVYSARVQCFARSPYNVIDILISALFEVLYSRPICNSWNSILLLWLFIFVCINISG